MKSLVGFCLIIIFFFACGKEYSNKNLTIFKYNESAGINTLDPVFAKDQATIWATNQLFNGLVQLDNSLNVIPSIANSWIISSDALNYTFNLRSDVYFHNHKFFKNGVGRKVLASDFEYSFNRLLDESLQLRDLGFYLMLESFYALNDSVFLYQAYQTISCVLIFIKYAVLFSCSQGNR